MVSTSRSILIDFLSPSHLLRYCRFGSDIPVHLYYLECRQPGRAFVQILSTIFFALHLLTGKWLRPPVRMVIPDDEARVPDYINVQASSFVRTTELIDLHIRGSIRRRTGVARLLDDDGSRSYPSRMLGARLRPVVLAVLTLRAMGIAFELVRLRNPDLSRSFTVHMAEQWKTPVLREPRWPDPKALTALLFALWPLRPIGKQDKGTVISLERWRNCIDIVNEFVDPLIQPETSTTPAYIVGAENPNRFLFYVSEDQEVALGHKRAVWQNVAPNVVFLTDLTFSAPRARATYCRGLWDLTALALAGQISGSGFISEARALRKFLALDGLFFHVRPRASIHTPFPNGNVGIRLDSGLVTSAARRYGVRSVGYQTRCTHLRTYEELFECYDVWCAWGEAWINEATDYGFLRGTEVIGAVNLDEFLKSAALVKADAAPAKTDSSLEIVVFETTLSHVDQFTESYLLGTIEITLRAAGQVRRETGIQFRVWIKTKSRSEIPFYENNHNLRRIAAEEDVPLACFQADRFQMAESMNFADAVVSVGFTTPGMDALLMGKPSFYYTVINELHSAFTPPPMFVVRHVHEMFRNLRDNLTPPPDVLDRFDPFRDGQSAERLRRAALGSEPASCDSVAGL